jgi:glycosyltransferase involved in cell wall biosynthesis
LTGAPEQLAVFLPSAAGGGVERAFADLVAYWRDEGVAVTVILADGRGPLLNAFAQGTRLIDLGVPRVSRAVLPLARLLRASPDLPLLSSMSHSNLAVLVAARFLACHRGAIVVQEAARFALGREGGSRLRRRTVRALLPWLYSRADAVVAVSDGVAEELAGVLRWPRERIRVVPNPLPLERIAEASVAKCPHPWLTENRIPVILGIGRLSPEKDFATLLRAFALLRQRIESRLILLGSGPEEGSLRSLVRQLSLDEAVDFCGFVLNPWAFMSRAQLVASSSLAEGFSMVLAEAMACGTNVVSVDSGAAVRALLPAAIFGPLCTPGDAAGLAAAMTWRLARPLPSSALRSQSEQFDIGLIAPRYGVLLRPSLNDCAPSGSRDHVKSGRGGRTLDEAATTDRNRMRL